MREYVNYFAFTSIFIYEHLYGIVDILKRVPEATRYTLIVLIERHFYEFADKLPKIWGKQQNSL